MAKSGKKTGLGKRITSAREQKGWNLTELGTAVGVSRSAVSQWESETTDPSSAKLRAIALRTNVDYDWLATGRGEGPDGASAPDLEQRPANGIIEIDIRAGLGGGGTAEGREVRHDGDHADPIKAESWHFPARFMREEIRAPESRVIVIETTGDSMSPTILSGDRVIVDTGHTLPSPDGIYAIRDQFGFMVVKRLQVMRQRDRRVIRIISDNKAHDAEDVGDDEIEIVGRVLWSLKRL